MSRVEHCLYIGSVGFFGTIVITGQTTGTLLNTRTFCGLATGTGTVFCFFYYLVATDTRALSPKH